jgi:hypothetical protein
MAATGDLATAKREDRPGGLVKLDPVAASKVIEAEHQDSLVVDRPNLIRPTRLPSQRVRKVTA